MAQYKLDVVVDGQQATAALDSVGSSLQEVRKEVTKTDKSLRSLSGVDVLPRNVKAEAQQITVAFDGVVDGINQVKDESAESARAFKGVGEAVGKFKNFAAAAGVEADSLALKMADVATAGADLAQVLKPGPAFALAAAIGAATYAYDAYVDAQRRAARITNEGLSATRLGKIRAEFPKLKEEAVVSLASVATKANLTTRDMVQLGVEAQKAARVSGKSFSEELQPALERVAGSVDAIRAKAASAQEALIQAASGGGNLLLDSAEVDKQISGLNRLDGELAKIEGRMKEISAIPAESPGAPRRAKEIIKLTEQLRDLTKQRADISARLDEGAAAENRVRATKDYTDAETQLAGVQEANFSRREQLIRQLNAAENLANKKGVKGTVAGNQLRAEALLRYNREILAYENQLNESLLAAGQGLRDAELEALRQAGRTREAERLAIVREGAAAERQARNSNEENAGARAYAIRLGTEAKLRNLAEKFAQEDRERAAEQNRVLLDLALDYAQKRQAALVQAAEGVSRADAEALTAARAASAESLRAAFVARDQKVLSEEQYADDVLRIQRELAVAEGKIRNESALRAADERRAAREQARADALAVAGRQGVGDNSLTGELGNIGVRQRQIEDIKLGFAEMGTAGVAAWSAIGAASETAGGIVAEVQSAISANIKQALTDTGYAQELRQQQAQTDAVLGDQQIQRIDKLLKATQDAGKRQELIAKRKARVEQLAAKAAGVASRDEAIEKKRATKEIIAGIAAQAAVKAIFTGAEAAVAAAFGSPTAPALAAAAVAYGSIAGVAAGVSAALGGSGRTSGEKRSLADLRKQREASAFESGAGDSAARAERRAEALSRRGTGGRTVVNITFAGAPLIPRASLGEYINTARAAAERLQ